MIVVPNPVIEQPRAHMPVMPNATSASRRPPCRWTRTVLGLALWVGLALGGCASSSSTTLPDLKRQEADSLLTPAQQQKAIADLARKKAEEEAEALKKIQQSR